MYCFELEKNPNQKKIFFFDKLTKNPNLFLFWQGCGGVRLTKNPNMHKNKNNNNNKTKIHFWGEGGGGAGRG